MADVTVEIKTSRAISAQIIRHKSFSYQEHSQRYAAIQFYENIELRKQNKKNRQDSLTEPVAYIDLSEIQQTPDFFSRLSFILRYLFKPNKLTLEQAISEIYPLLNRINFVYQTLISNDVSRETARFILPLTVGSKIYMKGSFRSWLHYFEVRAFGEGVQKEHRLIALKIVKSFASRFPIISEALDWDNKIKTQLQAMNIVDGYDDW